MPQAIPEHMKEEHRRAMRWNTLAPLGGLTAFAVGLILLPFVAHIAQTPGFSRHTLAALSHYLDAAGANPFAHYLYLFSANPNAALGVLETVFATLGYFALCGLCAAGIMKLNPYRSVLMIHGDARFATKRDVERMTRQKQVGWGGKHLHFGYFAGKVIALIETLSSLVIAPPGTGKTARFIIPAVLVSDEACLVIHDPKPELWEICSGHRAALGPCYRLDWARMDDEKNGVYHPRFNFLDPQIVPPDASARDTYVENLAKILIPDDQGKGDPHFTERGRGVLIGFIHFLIAHIEADEQGSAYEDLPAQWYGMPASLPMLIDWLNRTQLAAIKEAGESGENGKAQEDPLRPYLEKLVNIAIANDYPDRVVRELQPLILTADKERSGFFSTMDRGLAPFKNAAVSQRTARSDFVPADLSGRLKQSTLERLGFGDGYPETREDWAQIKPLLSDSDWEPVTVFVSIAQAEAAAFENLTALFFETLSKELLSYGPGETRPDGRLMGPFATGFIMDEVVKMAKCDAVIDGPDLGRSKQRFYMIVCQTIDQIKKRYSEEQKNNIQATCAVQVALPQNDPNTIKRISETVGKTTVKTRKIGRTVGLSKSANPFAGNLSEDTQAADLLNTSNLATMPPNTHLLLVQGWINRPIRCQSAVYFSDRKIKKLAYNPRTGRGPAQAEPVPLPLKLARNALRDARLLADAQAAHEEARLRALETWRYRQIIDLEGDTPIAGP